VAVPTPVWVGLVHPEINANFQIPPTLRTRLGRPVQLSSRVFSDDCRSFYGSRVRRNCHSRLAPAVLVTLVLRLVILLPDDLAALARSAQHLYSFAAHLLRAHPRELFRCPRGECARFCHAMEPVLWKSGFTSSQPALVIPAIDFGRRYLWLAVLILFDRVFVVQSTETCRSGSECALARVQQFDTRLWEFF